MRPIDELTNDAGLMVRSVEIRATADTEAREFTGLGVPYGEEIEHWFGRETFDPGSVDSDGARVFWNHREPIGRLTKGADTDAGHEVTGVISRTARGDEAMTLLRDEVIGHLSIGFEPQEYTVEKRDDGTEVIHWTKVRAREFSLVPFPAYESAAISNVRERHHPTPAATPREENPSMETDALTRADLTPITQQLTDLERSLDLVSSNTSAPQLPEGAQFRSMGEFLRAIVDGDEAAAEFHRAYTGGTTADAALTDTFVGNFIKLVRERRRIVNDFTTGVLPDKGMNVDFVQLKTDGTVVGRQATQGANLPYGKVELGRDTAKVETYGGYAELSRQEIERSDTPILDTTLEAMGLTYGKKTNAAVASTVSDLITARLALYNASTNADTTAAVNLAADAGPDGWLDMVVDAAVNREEAGYDIAGLYVTAQVFKELIRLKDGDNRLMTVYGQGVNQTGSLDLTQVSGNLANVTVKLLPHTTGRVASFYDPTAIKTLESPGAPAQLQDDTIINLARQFSLYGYMAILKPHPGAMLPVNFATAA
ncbi:HK97 family phage prohead protease [Nesterenkonia halotolerans]|uniref:HK97 family phage prohead protease n=1 Tax=Nesterenkonia halotolerans TaxID=225325 RepID=UPI003EE5809E